MVKYFKEKEMIEYLLEKIQKIIVLLKNYYMKTCIIY